MEKRIFSKLSKVQNELVCTKELVSPDQRYMYRSAEDILCKCKKLLHDVGAVIVMSDEIVNVGDRYYVKATASFVDTEDGETISVSACARECEKRVGWDESQLTGSCSSYARKYALCGLLAIDDKKQDPDALPRGNVKPTSTSSPFDTQMMTLEEAFAQVADLGNSAGHTLREIYQKQPKNLFWLLKNGSEQAEAIKIIIASDPELQKQN
jgi:hypothetical protein